MWDRKVEGGFPELKILVGGFLRPSFEISPAHDRVRTETTNKGQHCTRKDSGSLGCWRTFVDKHGVYNIVVAWLEARCCSSRGLKSRCFLSSQRRHRLTVRGHQVPLALTGSLSRKPRAPTHRWMARACPSSSTRQSPTVSPVPPIYFHQPDARSIDVEVKVDALTKLQAELEAGAEVRSKAPVPSRTDSLLTISPRFRTPRLSSVLSRRVSKFRINI